MSKQYMTIETNGGTSITIKTNSERAIKMAIKKIYSGLIGDGAVKTIEIKGNVIKFTYTEEKQFWGYWQPTSVAHVFITENTFAAEETTEAAEAPEVVEAPAAEVVSTEAAEVVSTEAPSIRKATTMNYSHYEFTEAEREEMHAAQANDARRFCYVQCQKYASMFAQAYAQRDLAKAERALVALGHYTKNYKRLGSR